MTNPSSVSSNNRPSTVRGSACWLYAIALVIGENLRDHLDGETLHEPNNTLPAIHLPGVRSVHDRQERAALFGFAHLDQTGRVASRPRVAGDDQGCFSLIYCYCALDCPGSCLNYRIWPRATSDK